MLNGQENGVFFLGLRLKDEVYPLLVLCTRFNVVKIFHMNHGWGKLVVIVFQKYALKPLSKIS